MKHTLLSLFLVLVAAFSSVQATTSCEDVKIVPLQKNLQSCDSNITEVIIYNPGYCYSKFTDISLTDAENFKLDVNYGTVPCGSLTPSTRGYEFCTVGVEFTPVTTSGDFTTDIQATQDSATFSSTINGKVTTCDTCTPRCHGHKHHKCHSHKHHKHHKSCDSKSYSHKSCGSKRYSHKSCGSKRYSHKSCGSKRYSHKSCGSKRYSHKSCGSKRYSHKSCGSKSYSHKSCGSKRYSHKSCGSKNHGHKSCHSTCGSDNNDNQTQVKNYLAGLNLIAPTNSSYVKVENDTLVFDNYNESTEGHAIVELDEVLNSSSMLTFNADIVDGLFMPIMYSDTGKYMTNDLRKTNTYGFIFPNNALNELLFTTWGVSFTGTLSNISLVEFKNEELLP